MNRSDPAARSYAEALILLAKEKGRLEPVLDDLRAVMGVFHGDRRLWGLFVSPRIDRAVKEAFVRKAFAGRVGAEVLGLLVILVRKVRTPLFDNVVDQFERFRDVEQKRIHVYLTTARAVDPEVRRAVEAAVAEASGKSVAMHEEVVPALLGGMVVRVGDTLVDGSLRARLSTLGRRLVGDR